MLAQSIHRWLAVGTGALLSLRVHAADGTPTPDPLCREWFGSAAQIETLSLADTNVVVQAVTAKGELAGWLFRTDQVPPVCKGKRGQIAVLVAVGTDSLIKGISVLDHREDPRYFRRLTKPFFAQFDRRPVNADPAKFDAVTKATLSSRAIIRDVMEGLRTVMAQPEIAARLSIGKKDG